MHGDKTTRNIAGQRAFSRPIPDPGSLGNEDMRISAEKCFTAVCSRTPIVELEDNSWRDVELDFPAAVNCVSSGFDAACLTY